MDYIIVIPSYNREQLLKDTTLKLLENIRKEIFVLTDKDYQYDLIGYPEIKQMIAPKGIGAVRNYIRKEFNGQRVLMIDDDILSIDRLEDNELIPVENLNDTIDLFWIEMEKHNAKLGGVNLHYNAWYASYGVSKRLTYINGSFTFLDLTDNQPPLTTQFNHFEDYDFTIQHFIRDGIVMKFKNICLKTKCFNRKGGIVEQLGGIEKRKKEALDNGQLIVNKYPQYSSLKYSKKYKIMNLKLKPLVKPITPI